MDKMLNLIGLAQKAGRLAAGEEPTGAAARARSARLILVAADAAENSVRRVRHFADTGQCLWCRIGVDKEALGRAVGRSSCAMLAITDVGFAEAIARRLAEEDERFAETAERLAVKAQRAAERRREAEAHEKNVRTGKKRLKERNAAETAEHVHPARAEVTHGGRRPAGSRKAGGAAVHTEIRTEAEAARKRTGKPSREERKRAAVKAAARSRYAEARPVKRGKGSRKKEKQ